MNEPTSSVPLSRGKRLCFAVLTALIVAVVPLMALELLVNLAGLRTSSDPYLQFGRVSSFFTDLKVDGVWHKKVASRDLYREREVTFPKQKPANAFRIFCLGGSASAGWPHPAEEAYSSYLEDALRRAYPDRRIEVYNVSAHAYAAYRVRLIFQEVIEFQPDLVIIYSGNNEFIEARTYSTKQSWLDPIAALANRFAVYRLVRGSFLGTWLFPENTFRAEDRENVAFEVWSKIERIPLTLHVDPAQLQKVKEHYEFSITSMLQMAKSRRVPVVLLTIPTNLRDWRPNVSVLSVRGEQRTAWEAKYQAGRAALLRGDAAAAIKSFTQAAALDPGHAGARYHLGRAYEAGGALQQAYINYDRARDLDANPFRAISSFNEIIRRIGPLYDNVTIVDAEKLFRDSSHPHAPGFDLFLDYVHPTRKGNLILAQGIFKALVGGGFIGPTSNKSLEDIAPSGAEEGAYDEARDLGLHVMLMYLAIMMHQNETVLGKAEFITANLGNFASPDEEDVGEVAAVLNLFHDVVALERRELLQGSVPEAEKYRLSVRLEQFYRDNFDNYDEFQRQRRARFGSRRVPADRRAGPMPWSGTAAMPQ